MKTIFVKISKVSLVLLLVSLAITSCNKGPDFPPNDDGGVIICDPPKDDGKNEPPTCGDGEKPNPLPENPENPDQCNFVGRIFHPIDGCEWSIKMSNGDWLYPVNQDKLAGFSEGDKITFGYVYQHDAFTACMAGYNIELTCVDGLAVTQ